MKKHASTRTGIESVHDVVQVYDIHPAQDGLAFASPTNFIEWKIHDIAMPKRLKEFLEDIRLLRRIPLSYLVPDPNLLPPESIRFFHIDQTWVDRVIDGIFSNTNTGTVDFHYRLTMLQLIRDAVAPAGPRTGILIRSDLTRRWPKMIVDGYSTLPAEPSEASVDETADIRTVRAEAISRDIFIALFDGKPRRVHIREPFEGVRFGVEPTDPDSRDSYKVDKRDLNGDLVNNDSVPVTFHPENVRTLNIAGLRDTLVPPKMQDSRGVALHLEQRPFVQVFLDNVPEDNGSVEPPLDMQVASRSGKTFLLKFAHDALFKLNG